MENTTPSQGGFQILLLLAFLIPAVLFMITQQNTLKAVKPENRLMQPGSVWLQLIPIFGLLWQFFVVIRIADSIKKEMVSRQDDTILGFSDHTAIEELNKRPTFPIGITYCILITICTTINVFAAGKEMVMLTQITAVGMLAGMICWVIYWVRLARYKTKLVYVAF